MKILAATDGTRTSTAALRFALRLASSVRGRLNVVTVSEIAGPGPVPRRLSPFEGSERRSVRAALERARRECRRATVLVRFAYAPSRGYEPFAETISREARHADADLVVVGSRGGTAASRWLLGSIANRLVHTSRVPVAVVRAGARDRRPKTILVATDGSPAAMKAVRFAARLTSSLPRARLVILTVSTLTADLALTAPGVGRALGVLPELERADRRAGTRILERAAKEARLGRRVTFRYYGPTRPRLAESAILEEAKRQRADMIVLGRTGRTALGDVLMGSVAQRVLALANRPVVLVPRSRGVKRARAAVSKRR
jgi:nucleotide-binding universal stress UspA family protein